MKVNNIFNNREIALIVYLIIFLSWALTQERIRKSIFLVIKALFAKKILFSILFLLIYVLFFIIVLYHIQFWDLLLFKDTIYWTFGTGLIIMFHCTNAIDDDKFFLKIVSQNIKLLLIIEYIVGLYVFGIIAEFFLTPIVIFLTALHGYSGIDQEYRKVNVFLSKLIGIIGLFYLFYSVSKIYQNIDEFLNYDNLRSFLFPIIMTILFLPFSYFFALYIEYESLFCRVNVFLKDSKSLRNYAKLRIILSTNYSLKKLKKIKPGYLFYECKTKNDIKNELETKLKK